MLEFRPIEISDKAKADECMSVVQYRSTESAFTDLYLWGEKFNTCVAFENGFMFVRSGVGADTRYLFPYGAGKFCAAISAIREDAERMGNTPCMVAVTDAMRDKLEICHHGEFSYTETRDTFDYIYSTEDLITLAGRKFSQKRNHINKFLSLYDGRYGYEDITAENLPEVAEFQARWVKENSTDENAAGLAHEMVAINRAFEHFFEIGLIGGIVRVDGDIAAYSLGTPLGDDGFLVSFEKGDYKFEGIYQIINREFVSRNCAHLKFVNREDDTGSAGLRRAKLSYKPSELLRKYRVNWL